MHQARIVRKADHMINIWDHKFNKHPSDLTWMYTLLSKSWNASSILIEKTMKNKASAGTHPWSVPLLTENGYDDFPHSRIRSNIPSRNNHNIYYRHKFSYSTQTYKDTPKIINIYCAKRIPKVYKYYAVVFILFQAFFWIVVA